MPGTAIPRRIVQAVEMLDVDPSDHVLEIGCGHGLAASLICEEFVCGRLVAIDRSRTMIEAARKRNAAHLAAGKVQFLAIALADADFGRRRFSKVFAINVNQFWIDPADELPVVKRLLRPEGALYLFYQPPNPAQLKPLAGKLSRNLETGGFIVEHAFVGKGLSAASLCTVARAAKDRA